VKHTFESTQGIADERPTLNFENHDGQTCQLAFGYMNNEPSAALFVGDSPEVVAIIPREVMAIAVKQGWNEEQQP
jgi:hypothetical protein